MPANKSPEAFRTISEVSNELGVPQHVLRFWETRFSQIKPLKRGGGRRYYRPGDVELIKGIQTLLHDEGYTIRGVQKVFRKEGVRFVSRIGRAGLERVIVAPADEGDINQAQETPQRQQELLAETVAAQPGLKKSAAANSAPAKPATTLPPEMMADEPQQLSLVPEQKLSVTPEEHKRLTARLDRLTSLKTQLTATLEARAKREGETGGATPDKDRAASA